MHSSVVTLVKLGAISILAMACTRPTGFEIRQDLTTTLEKNQTVNSHSEWINSEHNSEATFSRWKDLNADPKEICEAFSYLSPKNIAFFEEEIKSENYEDLVALCRAELIEKIETYWSQEKSKMEISATLPGTKSTFKFPENAQTRDVSYGYKAVTADLNPKEVILTFDDGPHPEYTDRVLEALESVNAKGLFFALGKNVEAHPEVLKRVGLGGHSVGSHSVDHKCLPAKGICAKNNGRMLSYAEAIAQIKGGHQAVFNVLGWVDPFFRFPYGESSAELSLYLREHSVGEFYWSVDSEDWKNRTPSEMLQNTLAQIDKRGGGNVLFHDVQRKTAEALPEFLRQIYYKGYSVVLLRSSNPKDRSQSKLVK